MNRKAGLALALVAGYHGDAREFTRLQVEAGVGLQALKEAWANGVRARANGVPCACIECKPDTGGAPQ